MNVRIWWSMALTALAALVIQAGLQAQTPAPVYSVITIDDMHCPNCAKKIAAKLKDVPAVGEVRMDVPTSNAFVIHQAGKAPSPRVLWEAVEKAGYRPTRFQGPSGTFTSKPQS